MGRSERLIGQISSLQKKVKNHRIKADNPKVKWAKDFNSLLTKEDMHMATKPRKSYSVPLVAERIQQTYNGITFFTNMTK